jgi:2'-5' RNA ligase
MARLFFALWPDAQTAQRLAQIGRHLAAEAGGKPVAPGNIHLTVAFMGEVPESRIDAAREAARARAFRAFDLELDLIGCFRGARVAWSAPSGSPSALAELVSGLEAALRDQGFPLEARPFVAHVTLARKIARPVGTLGMEAVRWHVRELVLARTDFGTGRYAALDRWKLDRNGG